MADYFPLWLTFRLRFLELASAVQGRTNGLHGALTDVGLRLLARRTVPTERNTNQGRLSNRFARLLRHWLRCNRRGCLYGGVHRLGDSRVGLPERNIRGSWLHAQLQQQKGIPHVEIAQGLAGTCLRQLSSLSAYAQEAVVTLSCSSFLPAHSLTQANLLAVGGRDHRSLRRPYPVPVLSLDAAAAHHRSWWTRCVTALPISSDAAGLQQRALPAHLGLRAAIHEPLRRGVQPGDVGVRRQARRKGIHRHAPACDPYHGRCADPHRQNPSTGWPTSAARKSAPPTAPPPN